MKSPLYIETFTKSTGETSFLFVKRINSNKGTFAVHHSSFPARFKRNIGSTPSMTISEAGTVALDRSKAIEHLQSVSQRDKAGRTNSTKDLINAAKTWIWFNDIENLSDLRAESSRPTARGELAGNTLALLTEAVKSFYKLDVDGYTHTTTYTPLGDYLLNILNSGSVNHLFSEAVEVWANQTNRGHLSTNAKSIRDAHRFVGKFNEFIGDRPIEQITRANVASYITHRCKSVKTTSVDREIHTLRAVWNKAADALDINHRNPFERQAIYGLGTDATKRATPSCDQHKQLMLLLDKHKRKNQSYVVPMLAIIGLTGMRLSEVWGLQPEDLDREKSLLLICPNELRRLKTDQSERPFPVSNDLSLWIDIYFTMKRPSSANAASAAIGKFLESNDFKLTAHCLRHGFKQRLTEVDTPANVIEELMGWSNQSMIRHYGLNAVTSQKRKSVELAHKLITNYIDEQSEQSSFNQNQLYATEPTKELKKNIKNHQVTFKLTQAGRNMASRLVSAYVGE